MNNWIHSALVTCGFELRRSFTFQRAAVSVVMALFPPMMMTLLILGPKAVDPSTSLSFAEFVIVFLVALVCLLTLLLWATPNVYSELEGKSWLFIASRPGGRIGIFLGKYFAAVLGSFAVSFVALSLSVAIVSRIGTLQDPLRLWFSLCGIYGLACLSYGAVFSLIGTITYRRAMVVGVGYLIAWEIIMANLPALVNRLAVRYHLQSLGIAWLGYFLPPDTEEVYSQIYGPQSPAFHLLALAVVTILCLLAGMFVIVNRQYITSDET